MNQVVRKRLFRGIGIFCLFVLVGIGVHRYYGSSAESIQHYLPSRDRDEVSRIFEQNWYWLINVPYKAALASFAKDLDRAESVEEKKKADALEWVVFREDGVAKGFIAYFIKAPAVGKILFLAVDAKYRGHGCALRLINHAISVLEKAGCKKIEILVRIENFRAQNLYRKVGFEVVKTDSTFMYMEMER